MLLLCSLDMMVVKLYVCFHLAIISQMRTKSIFVLCTHRQNRNNAIEHHQTSRTKRKQYIIYASINPFHTLREA